MPQIDVIRKALAGHAPTLDASATKRAAVALVLRGPADDAEALFIERARHPGDPWSGHMAFPGGRVDPGDASPRSAAERETQEEVGLDLAPAELLGRLDDLAGRHAGRPVELVISAFVYHHDSPEALTLNYEVEDALWFPLRELREASRHVDLVPREGSPAYPGIRVGASESQVVWGLTYRFLELFLAVAGAPLPDRWEALRDAGLITRDGPGSR